VKQKFHELLGTFNPKYEVKGTKEVAYVAKKTDGGSTDDNGGEGGGSTDPNE